VNSARAKSPIITVLFTRVPSQNAKARAAPRPPDRVFERLTARNGFRRGDLSSPARAKSHLNVLAARLLSASARTDPLDGLAGILPCERGCARPGQQPYNCVDFFRAQQGRLPPIRPISPHGGGIMSLRTQKHDFTASATGSEPGHRLPLAAAIGAVIAAGLRSDIPDWPTSSTPSRESWGAGSIHFRKDGANLGPPPTATIPIRTSLPVGLKRSPLKTRRHHPRREARLSASRTRCGPLRAGP